MASICAFQLSMRSFEIDGEDADVDGLDDVLVEFLQPLELADLFFEPRVEAGVLERDADVAGQGFEQLDIFAGEEVAADGAAEADDGDGACGGAVLHAAGQVVVQIEQGGGLALAFAQVQRLLRVFEEDVRVVGGLVEVEEAQVERTAQLCIGRGPQLGRQAVCGSEAQHSGLRRRERQRRARPAACAAAARRWIRAGAEVGFGAEAAAELDQSFAVVIAMAIEGAIDPALNAALEGIEDGRGDEDRDDQRPLAHRLGQALVNELGDEGDDAEVAAQDQSRWPACRPRRA